MERISDLTKRGMGYHRAAKAVLASKLAAAKGSPLYDELVRETVARLRGELQRACSKYPGFAAWVTQPGATQDNVAKRCGMSRSRVSGLIERAKRVVELRGKGTWERVILAADNDARP